MSATLTSEDGLPYFNLVPHHEVRHLFTHLNGRIPGLGIESFKVCNLYRSLVCVRACLCVCVRACVCLVFAL
jgi:hypothetical protein